MSDITPNQIREMWAKDCKIDRNDLTHELLQIDCLEAKYGPLWESVDRQVRVLESELKRLVLDKYEFYTQGPSRETRSRGWKPPSKGNIDKKFEAMIYVEADVDILGMKDRLGEMRACQKRLEDILSTIRFRGGRIKDALTNEMFLRGVK